MPQYLNFSGVPDLKKLLAQREGLMHLFFTVPKKKILYDHITTEDYIVYLCNTRSKHFEREREKKTSPKIKWFCPNIASWKILGGLQPPSPQPCFVCLWYQSFLSSLSNIMHTAITLVVHVNVNIMHSRGAFHQAFCQCFSLTNFISY